VKHYFHIVFNQKILTGRVTAVITSFAHPVGDAQKVFARKKDK